MNTTHVRPKITHNNFTYALLAKNFELATAIWDEFNLDQQKSWFDQMFIECLKACENDIIEVESDHLNKNLRMVEMKSANPDFFSFFFRFLTFLQNHSAGFTTYILQALSRYTLAPFIGNDQFAISTSSTTWTTSVIVAEIYGLLELCQSFLDDITLCQFPFDELFNTVLEISLHPEMNRSKCIAISPMLT